MAATKKQAKPFELSADNLQQRIVHHLRSTLGTHENKANDKAWWSATCAAINELVFEKLTDTQATHAKKTRAR